MIDSAYAWKFERLQLDIESLKPYYIGNKTLICTNYKFFVRKFQTEHFIWSMKDFACDNSSTMYDDRNEFNNLHDEMEIAEEVVYKEDEHEGNGESHSDIVTEVEEEESEHCGEALKMEISTELEEKLKEYRVALTSTEFTVRLHGAKGLRDMLQGESGKEALQLYVKMSPDWTELLKAWKLGIEGKSSVSIFLLIVEILKHPGGKDDCPDEQRRKTGTYVSLRVDKLANTILTTKMHDIYEEINSHGQKRQNAALLLLAAIVRRGRIFAYKIAESFDFENKVFHKLAEWPKSKRKGGADNKKTKFLTRRGFIEFAVSFLEVSTPSILRHVLRKQSLYGGVLRGLGNDDEETIVYVLGLMREKVLSASSTVPSWVRSAVFGDTALEQLSIISADFSLGKAAAVAHEILLILCTDSRHGLFPEFPQAWGILNESKKIHGGNPARLLRLMLKLRSSDVGNHRNLLLAIVSNQPSLVSAYLDSFPYSLEPRVSSTWFAAISLVSDLIQASKASPSVSSLAIEGSSPPSLEYPMLCDKLKCILPRSFSRAIINRGLLHANLFVKHGTLRVLKEALDSLESLLDTIRSAAENVTRRGHFNEPQKECLSKCIFESHSMEVKGLSGLKVLRALSGLRQCEEKSSNALIELSRQKWFLHYREVQDEVRGLLPDPQVLLSLLSSTKARLTGSASKSNKRNFPSANSKEVEAKSKVKKKKSGSIDSGVEIVVSGINHGDRKDMLEGSVAVYPNQDSLALDNMDEDLISITQIWGTQDVVSDRDESKDEESVLYTKVLNVLGLYQVAETRFASHTIVLRRLVRVKEALCQMVISNKWGGWKQVDTEKAKIVKDLIFNDDFWNRVEYALELTEPLMSMLRYADTDEPCLGNIYDAMDSMLERMKSVIQRREQDPDTLYSTVEKIVLHRWNKMTTPLHLLAYALSPRYYSSEILDIPGRVPPYRDPEVAAGYKRALSKLFSDPDVASNVRREFVDFVSGKFAEPDAINDQSRLDAIGWWYLHGERYMYLQPLAIKILSQRTLPIAMSDCSFDAFKLLPEEPLHLSTSHQQAILSLLVETTGGLKLLSSGFESHGPITGQLYKYLRPVLKLMLYSPAKDVRKYAHLVAYRAMLSTCAFERNKGEIEVWFSFLSVQNFAEMAIKKSQEIHLHEYKINDMSGGLASTVVDFLCDAVSAVGKNLFKYLDELHCLLSTFSSRGDLAPPHFSPLVICVLQKCPRVVESSSKSQKLAHRTMISFYVASVMNFLLQAQANSRSLSVTIVTTLLPKINQVYQSNHGSEDFLCEWSPLRSLLHFAQGVLSKEQVGSSLESIDTHFLGKGNPTVQRSLAQVLSLVENIDCERKFGAATAFAFSIVSAMPEEIVENFPSLVTLCHRVFGKNFSVLLALLCAHRDLFGRIAEAWGDYFLLGLKLARYFYQTSRDNGNLQVHHVDKQHSSLDDGFKFYQMRHKSTEKQALSVSMGGGCSNNPATVAFVSFIQSIPFSVLFMLSANCYQSKLLSCMHMKAILEAKLSRVSFDYINMLQLILHWILQIESSSSEGADSKEQLETCFSLLRHLLIHAIEGFWSDYGTDRLDVSLDMMSIEEIIHTVLGHPVINMFMHKWMCCSVSKNTKGLENCDTEHEDLHCDQWQIKADQPNWKIFLGLCKDKLHVFDNGILNLLMTLMKFVSSQCKINQGHTLNQWESYCKAIVASSKPLIMQSFAVFKNKISKRMKGNSYEIYPLPSFYVLSVLSPFVSPFSLLELVHWLFSNDIYEHKENATSVPHPNISYLDIGLYFGTVAFDMFHAYLNQANGDACIQKFFWDLEGQNIDQNLVKEVYVKIVEVAIKQNSRTSEICLLAAMKALHVQTGTNIPPCLLPIGMFLAQLSVVTPIELVKYCIYNTNRMKAEILLLLTQISNLHLTVYGELIGANMAIYPPAIHLIHVTNGIIIDENYLEENTDFKLSENDLLVLLPVTLKYISANLRREGASFLLSLKTITDNYFNILWKGFMKWDKYTCFKEFNILEYDEERYMTVEDFVCYFQDSLLGQAIQMLKAFPNLETLRKKRRKLFSSILSNIRCLLDYFNNDTDTFSFKEMLNVGNRVIAKVSLARWLLFPKYACLTVHLERNSDEQPQNGVTKCSSGKITESDIFEWKMETSEYAMFINCLIGSLNAIFQSSSIQSQTFCVMESRNRANLLNFIEKTILNNLVDVSKEIGVQSVSIQHVPLLKAFTKLIFLHRFENCMALKTLRCLLLLLSVKGHDSDIVVQFAEDALTLLMAHSQFMSTILSTSFESSKSLDQSDKGTMFRSLPSILNLLAFSSPGQHEALNSENMTIYSSGHITGTKKMLIGEDLHFVQKRKLEIVKLLRMLYLLRIHHGSSSRSGETFMNAKKLVSLLLAGYGATINDCDLEIYSLLHEIECFSLKNICGLSEMDYLWGEAALKTTQDREKEFRDNLLIDPKVCGETIVYFPFNRSAWDGPLDLPKFAERSFKNITLETEERPSLNSSCTVCYDPAFLLEFSLHALAVRFIEPMDFSRIGLLGIAFASLSSPSESMRKLAYAVLARYTQSLENGRNFKGRSEILLLLTHVKNGIVEPWQKIPSVLAIFAAESSCILMDPTNNHYTAIIRYLMGTPTMVLERIPLFHKMFGSGKDHYQNDRVWILRLVAAGLNLTDDFQIYRRKFVLEFLMSFYGSPLADFKTKLLVLQALQKAVKRQALAHYMVQRAGLLLWLSSAVLNCDKSKLGRSELCFVSIALEMIVDLLSWRSICQQLLTNGFEQLSQTASCLHHLLVYNSSMLGCQDTSVKSVLHILASTICLSQQQKLYQTHFCLSFEGLFQVIQFIEIRDPDMISKDISQLGLKIILTSFPPAVNTIEDKLKLLKLALWAISSALQAHTLPSFEEEEYADKQWKSIKQYQEALMDKLLRWLAASIICGKILWMDNQRHALYPMEKPNFDNLLSLIHSLKASSCVSEIKENPEVDMSLAQLILYLHQLVGVRCRVLKSIVAAVSLLLHSGGINIIAGRTSWHTDKSSMLALLLSKVPCPVEVNPSWRWSFYSPWEDLSLKISEKQILYEKEVCQVLLRSYQNILSATKPTFHFIISRQKSGLSDSVPSLRNELCNKLDGLKEEMCKIISDGKGHQVLDNFPSS